MKMMNPQIMVLGTALLVVAFVPLTGALASGGPVDERTLECRGTARADGAVPLVVFRLHTAPSSETRGNALVYDDERARGRPKTSMSDCFELAYAATEPLPAGSGERTVVCGSPERPRDQSRARVRANRAGYRAILEGTKARLEKVQGSSVSSVFGELSCAEKPGR